jgi:methyl-accepting chemotaxis protein
MWATSRPSVSAQLTALVLAFALVAIAGWASLLVTAREQSARGIVVAAKNTAGDALLEAITALQLERGLTNSALQTASPASPDQIAAIKAQQARVDDFIKAAEIDETFLNQELAKQLATARGAVERSLAALKKLRADAISDLAKSRELRDGRLLLIWFNSASATITDMRKLWSLKAAESGRLDPEVAHLNRIKFLAAEMREIAGEDRAMLESAIDRSAPLRPTELQKIESRWIQLETIWGIVLTLCEAYPGRFDEAIFGVLAKYFTAYEDARKSLVFASENALPYPVNGAKFGEIADPALAAFLDLARTAMKLADEGIASRKTETEGRMLLAVSLLAVAVILSVAMVGFAHLNIGRPIGRMTRALASLAKGEKVSLVGIRRSSAEIAALLDTINIFRARIEENATLTAADAESQAAARARQERIEAAITEFEHTASASLQNIATASTQFGHTAVILEGAVGETDAVIRNVGTMAQLAADNMQSSAATVTQMSGSIEEIAQKIGQNSQLIDGASYRAGEANAQSHALGDAMARISEIVTLVAQIAQQTNLLALNATIEAARAGDAGRGFAVVASEVKGLASQTSTATADIGAQIEAIRGAARATIETVAEIRTAIDEVNAAGSIIASAVQEQNISASEISRTAQETASHAGKVLDHMENLQAASERTRVAADEARLASGQLVGGSEELRRAIDRFLADVRAA